MKKYIYATLLAAASLLGTATANAEYYMVVNTNDGEATEFAFEYCPEVTFEGNEMVVMTEDLAEGIRYNMADVKNIMVTDQSKVKGVMDNSLVTVKVTKQSVNISGLPNGDRVSIYNASGALVASGAADGNGSVSIAVDGLGKGVYVVSMAGKSFKFIR